MKFDKVNVFKKTMLKENSTLNLVLLIITAVIMIFNIQLTSANLILASEERAAFKEEYAMLKIDFLDLGASNVTKLFVKVDLLEDDGLSINYFQSDENRNVDSVFLEIPRNEKVRVRILASRGMPHVNIKTVEVNKLYPEFIKGYDHPDRIRALHPGVSYDVEVFEEDSLNMYTVTTIIFEEISADYYAVFLRNLYGFRPEIYNQVGHATNYFDYNFLNEVRK